MEDEYRRENLRFDIAQAVLVAVSASAVIAGILWMDHLFYEHHPGLFRWMIGYRGAYVVFTSIIAYLLVKVRTPKLFDAASFTWLLFTAVYLILFNFTRPSDYLTTVFDILYPFGVYMLSPLRLKYTFALSASFSLGTLFVDYFYKTGIHPLVLNAALISQILIHLLGLPAALQIQSYRRRYFKSYIDQKDAREMANYLINIDALTKCMTRQYFLSLAEKEFACKKLLELPLSLLMLDIDHFKKINDAHGHRAGDKALQNFAEVVLEQKRAQDIFGRLGGEEFGLLLPNTTLENALSVAQRIQGIWAQSPIIVDTQVVQSTVSIGVVEANPSDLSFDELLHRADNMMYKAKRRGRNRVASE